MTVSAPIWRGVADVRATAELARPGATDLDDADLLVVVLAEQRQRAELARLAAAVMYCADTGRSWRTARFATSSISLRVSGDRRLAPGEVEPQVAGLVVGAGLQRRRAEHLAQRRVHDVGAGVRLAGRDAPLGVDLGGDVLADAQRAGEHLDGVRDQALDGALDVDDLEVRAVGGDDALVGDLATGLGVERGAVEDDLAALAGLELLDARRRRRRGRGPSRRWSARGRPASRSRRARAGPSRPRCWRGRPSWPCASALARSRCSCMRRREARRGRPRGPARPPSRG